MNKIVALVGMPGAGKTEAALESLHDTGQLTNY